MGTCYSIDGKIRVRYGETLLKRIEDLDLPSALEINVIDEGQPPGVVTLMTCGATNVNYSDADTLHEGLAKLLAEVAVEASRFVIETDNGRDKVWMGPGPLIAAAKRARRIAKAVKAIKACETDEVDEVMLAVQ